MLRNEQYWQRYNTDKQIQCFHGSDRSNGALYHLCQLGKTVIEKTLDDVTEITTDSVSVKLTQEDTLLFKASAQVEIQIRAGFGGENGDRVRSNIMMADVEKILKDGEI